MFFLIFFVGVGTHYIYRGLGMDLFGFWILDFWVDFGWILWDEGEQKVGFAEKKLRLWVLAWGSVGVGIKGPEFDS